MGARCRIITSGLASSQRRPTDRLLDPASVRVSSIVFLRYVCTSMYVCVCLHMGEEVRLINESIRRIIAWLFRVNERSLHWLKDAQRWFERWMGR